MSIASWYVIVTKAQQLWRFSRAGTADSHEFWDATNLTEALRTLDNGNPFADIAQAASTRCHINFSR